MLLCQEDVILMKNGCKKMAISHGFHNKNSNEAFCFACKKSIDLHVNVMGESALVSHMKDKKHKEYVKKSSRQ